ncbi:exo-alpha-sialidase [Candidatus Woesearchaeota archaeon]|nr:exo-alpha-sialidase [Candidatus Woesearchaeota archaeon]
MKSLTPFFLIIIILFGCSNQEIEKQIKITDNKIVDSQSGSAEDLIYQTLKERGEQLAKKYQFSPDPEFRIDYASNPLIMGYTDGILSLGYEYQTKELKNAPSERGYLATTEDGLEFSEGRRFTSEESRGPFIQLADGTYKRYRENNEGYVVSESSSDGLSFYQDAGTRYNLNEYDQGRMGVRTFFVDAEGGVVLLYNSDVIDENGNEIIYVRRAYSEPENNGEDFVFEDDDVLEIKNSDGIPLSFADPHAIVLEDGTILLITMHQKPGPKPPLGKTGTLYLFISTDGGRTFAEGGEILDYTDYSDLEVRSLNDPKFILLEDGALKLYFAAMVPDETDYKWIIVSATAHYS